MCTYKLYFYIENYIFLLKFNVFRAVQCSRLDVVHALGEWIIVLHGTQDEYTQDLFSCFTLRIKLPYK